MKKNVKGALALGMVLAVSGSTVAFADSTEVVAVDTTAAVTEETTEEVTEEVVSTEAEKVTQDFITNEGTITDVSEAQEDGSYVVTIANEQGGLRVNVSADSIIVDRATGASIAASDLTVDMVISVIYPEHSPMGMSMPPYLGSATAIVANADQGEYMVGFFNDDLVDANNQLKLNIGEDTVLTNTGVSKIGVIAEMVKSQNALVFYDITTRSLPAQTTPSFVMILEKAVDVVDETIDPRAEVEETTEAEEAVEEVAIELIALRDTAEGKGFTVTWQGKDKAILVESADCNIEITMNDAVYVINGEEKEAEMVATLVDGVMYVSSEILG